VHKPSLSSTTPTPLKPTDRLVVLPFRKSLDIAWQSIRVRFFRSFITAMSLVLAVSFLSFGSVNHDIANGLLATHDTVLREVLNHSGYDLNPGDTRVGSSPKMRWIVILSLLVCVVGIINAQLMAVTERFREIGTMKCLGALDSFILRLFLLEAGIQGLVGSAIGALSGGLFSLLNGVARFGTVVLTCLPWMEAVESILLATGVGCLLSLTGVLYPAIVAARMLPVEAMRTEH
jgi:predicted lysophospholipase L1 biosynthesis ABC-type transport system permease subunit